MSRHVRIASYGSAAALIVAGTLCAILLAGGTAQVLAFVLIALGLVALTALLFLEVGLSEDRERARRRPVKPPKGPGPRRGLRRSRLPRTRGHR